MSLHRGLEFYDDIFPLILIESGTLVTDALFRFSGKVVFAEVAVSSLSVDGAKILDSDWATAAAHLTTPPIRTQKNNASVLIHLLSK